jgi:hypothetical protein
MSKIFEMVKSHCPGMSVGEEIIAAKFWDAAIKFSSETAKELLNPTDSLRMNNILSEEVSNEVAFWEGIDNKIKIPA